MQPRTLNTNLQEFCESGIGKNKLDANLVHSSDVVVSPIFFSPLWAAQADLIVPHPVLLFTRHLELTVFYSIQSPRK